MMSSAEEFVRLRLSSNPDDHHRAAHDTASLQVWREVITLYPDMRKWAARNKTVPVEILALLAEDQDADVRAAVAEKRNLPEYLQLLLANDSDEGVRGRLVYNAKATQAVLLILAADSWDRVAEHARRRLAELLNPSAQAPKDRQSGCLCCDAELVKERLHIESKLLVVLVKQRTLPA